MVEPTGVPARIEISIPKNAQTTEITAEQIVTDLKLLNILIADRAGKMISAEINNANGEYEDAIDDFEECIRYTDDDRTRFVSELKDFLNRDDVSNVTVAELKSFVASTEKHDYNEKRY